MEFLLYLLLGAAAGVLAGLFGVGGGMIIVPVLVYSFQAQGFAPEVLTHMAVGTSLATIAFTSINSIRAHQQRGAVRWEIVRWLTLGILGGSVLGGLTAALLQGDAAAEDHRRVRHQHGRADGLRLEAQGQRRRARQGRSRRPPAR